MFWRRIDEPRPLEVANEVPIPDVDIMFARKLMDNSNVEKLKTSNPDLNVSEEVGES